MYDGDCQRCCQNQSQGHGLDFQGQGLACRTTSLELPRMWTARYVQPFVILPNLPCRTATTRLILIDSWVTLLLGYMSSARPVLGPNLAVSGCLPGSEVVCNSLRLQRKGSVSPVTLSASPIVSYNNLALVTSSGEASFLITCVCYQLLKCHWSQGNAVPAPPNIEIQRSHTSNFFFKRSETHNHLSGGPELTYRSLTPDFPL